MGSHGCEKSNKKSTMMAIIVKEYYPNQAQACEHPYSLVCVFK